MEKFFAIKYKYVFLALAALILFPTWRSGYLFFLDWGVDPFLDFSDIDFWSHSLIRAVLMILATIFPFGLYQKVALFALMYFLGIGGWKLAETLLPENENDTPALIAKYFAGFLLFFNPFIYGRLADGQYGVVLSIFFILMLVVSLLRFSRSEEKKYLFHSGLYSALAVMSMLHAVFFIIAACSVFFLFFAIRSGRYLKSISHFFAVISVAIILNANVIAGFMLQKNQAGQIVQNFDQQHLEAFDTAAFDNTSVYFNVLSLHGYWGEKEERFISTQNQDYIWKPIFVLLFTIFIFGAFSGIRAGRRETWILIALGAASFVLAVGISGDALRPINQFLYDNVPFYLGLREPQKWVGLLLICYAGLGSVGLSDFLRNKEIGKQAVVWGLGILFLLLVYTPTMLFGFLGQLKPSDFPADWYEMKKDISAVEGKILFLPWNQYPVINFAGGREIANPAKAFFGDNVIQGDNMETSTVFTQSARPESRIIENVLFGDVVRPEKFAQDLKSIGISHIILYENGDYADYEWLAESESLELLKTGPTLRLYRLR